MGKDYYAQLGIEKNATADEIKKAFRKLAHKYHPDKSGGDEAKFKEISEAYNVLSDEKRRAEYDSYGRVFNESGNTGAGGFGGFDFSGAQGGFNAQGFDFSDIFSDIFGGGGQRVKRGRDISIDIEVSFRDAVFGVQRKVLLTKTSSCATCDGTGAKRGTAHDTCKNCNGKGQIHETKQSPLGSFSSSRVCDNCHGAGEIPKEKCSECKGLGVVRKEEELTINIPANVNNGEMIRMSGAGEAIPGGTPGDLYIKLHVQEDKRFKREGQNILTTLNIKLTDALLGGEYKVETLDGDLSVKIPAGASPNEILRVREKGVPITTSKRGDLLINLNVQLPKKLSRKAKKLVEDLKSEGV